MILENSLGRNLLAMFSNVASIIRCACSVRKKGTRCSATSRFHSTIESSKALHLGYGSIWSVVGMRVRHFIILCFIFDWHPLPVFCTVSTIVPVSSRSPWEETLAARVLLFPYRRSIGSFFVRHQAPSRGL